MFYISEALIGLIRMPSGGLKCAMAYWFEESAEMCFSIEKDMRTMFYYDLYFILKTRRKCRDFGLEY